MPRRSALQQEISQSRPFRSAAEEATLGIVRTATFVRRAVARVVASEGITPSQYNVLRILRGAGPEGLPTLAVRRRMLEEAPGITRLLDRLEIQGLVRRERSRPDRRQVMCYITPPGLALLERLDAVIREGDESGATGLTPAEQRQLIRLLDKVRASAKRSDGATGR